MPLRWLGRPKPEATQREEGAKPESKRETKEGAKPDQARTPRVARVPAKGPAARALYIFGYPPTSGSRQHGVYNNQPATRQPANSFAWVVSAPTPLTKEEREEEGEEAPKVQAVKAAPKRTAAAKAAAGNGAGTEATAAEGVGVTKRARVDDPTKLRSSSTQRMVSHAMRLAPRHRPAPSQPATGRSGARLTATPIPSPAGRRH